MAGTCRSWLPRPIGVYRGRACGNQQPSPVIRSCLHVVDAVHAIRAQQRAAGAPIAPIAAQVHASLGCGWCSDRADRALSTTAQGPRPPTQTRPYSFSSPPAAQEQLPEHRMAGTCRSWLPRPIGVYRGRACGNQQPSPVTRSCLHVVHAVHAARAQQTAAGRSVAALSAVAPIAR